MKYTEKVGEGDGTTECKDRNLSKKGVRYKQIDK